MISIQEARQPTRVFTSINEARKVFPVIPWDVLEVVEQHGGEYLYLGFGITKAYDVDSEE